jgi:cutinase
MSGYSQGGQLVHNTAMLLPASTIAKASSAVIFGDPDFGQAITGATSSKTKVICHLDNNICQYRDLILLIYLIYLINIKEAAMFTTITTRLALGN